MKPFSSKNKPSTSKRREADPTEVSNSDGGRGGENTVQNGLHNVANIDGAACSSISSNDINTEHNGESSKTVDALDYDNDSEEGACALPLAMGNTKNWADAPEFIPRCKQAEALITGANANKRLCPYASRNGSCNIATCNNLHGEFCDLCERYVLHPFNEAERKRHRQACLATRQRNMERSFALQRSQGKTCGICLEVVIEKANNQRRFGILPNCNHCFCLCCIRRWRRAHQFTIRIIRACPQCRVISDFVCPSIYWVDTKEEKNRLINGYKNVLASKPCRYFSRGLGRCPFANNCFYMHADAEGRLVDVGPPLHQRRRRYAVAERHARQAPVAASIQAIGIINLNQ